jgi:DNA-directed RNA polymerase subunit RPC12/RpoP
MGSESKSKFGIVLNVKCYHPKEDKEYQCKTIEGTDPEYQGYRCPKCNHEICITIEQHYLNSKDLKDNESKRALACRDCVKTMLVFRE